MLRSLWSGASGLKSHQTNMDVIGNNISNVNTTGFRSKSTSFSDVLYQTTANATPANENRSSINPRQIGLGARVSAITSAMNKEGSTMTTGYFLDARISNLTNGFFTVVGDGQDFYTRDGAFGIDAAQNLVLRSNGFLVQGWQSADGATVDRTEPLGNLNLAALPDITYTNYATKNIFFNGNLVGSDDALGIGISVNTQVYSNTGDQETVTFLVDDGKDADPLTFGFRVAGLTDEEGQPIDTSNATFKVTFDPDTNAVKSVNGRAGSVYSTSIPGIGQVNLDFSSVTGVAGATDDPIISDASKLPNWVVMDAESEAEGVLSAVYTDEHTYVQNNELEKTVPINHAASTLDFSQLNAGNVQDLVGKGFYTTCCTCDNHYSIEFTNGTGVNPTGANPYPESSGNHIIYRIGVDGVQSGEQLVNLIMEATEGISKGAGGYQHYTAFHGEGAVLTIYDGRSKEELPGNAVSWNDYDPIYQWGGVNSSKAAGLGLVGRGVAYSSGAEEGGERFSAIDVTADAVEVGEGSRNGVELTSEGFVYATYSNGERRLVGQIAIAQFANPVGLNNTGTNLYEVSMNSGEPRYFDINELGGSITTGALEMSNVDLSQEMTAMIIDQRGFQANSRIIATSDELLQTLRDLRR